MCLHCLITQTVPQQLFTLLYFKWGSTLSDVHLGQKTLLEHLKLKIRKVLMNRHPLFPGHVLAGISKLPGKRGCIVCTLGFFCGKMLLSLNLSCNWFCENMTFPVYHWYDSLPLVCICLSKCVLVTNYIVLMPIKMNSAEMSFAFLLIWVLFLRSLILNSVFSGLARDGVTMMMAFQTMKSKGRGPLTLKRNSKVTDTTRILSKLWMGKVCAKLYMLFSSCTDVWWAPCEFQFLLS